MAKPQTLLTLGEKETSPKFRPDIPIKLVILSARPVSYHAVAHEGML